MFAFWDTFPVHVQHTFLTPALWPKRDISWMQGNSIRANSWQQDNDGVCLDIWKAEDFPRAWLRRAAGSSEVICTHGGKTLKTVPAGFRTRHSCHRLFPCLAGVMHGVKKEVALVHFLPHLSAWHPPCCGFRSQSLAHSSVLP